MDCESYLSEMYSTIKAIELLSDIIYTKSNEDWNLYRKIDRKDADELLALNSAIALCAKELLQTRKLAVNQINIK